MPSVRLKFRLYVNGECMIDYSTYGRCTHCEDGHLLGPASGISSARAFAVTPVPGGTGRSADRISTCEDRRQPSAAESRLGRRRVLELGDHSLCCTFELVVVGQCSRNGLETRAQRESGILG